MKHRAFPVIAAAALLAGCGSGGDGNSSTPSAPAGSVKAVAAPAGQDWTQVVSQTPEGGYVMGNPAAALKLVEYGSRTCPTCGAFGQTGMRPLEETYVKSGKVSYEFRDFLVHGPPDLAAALLGRCAGAQPFFPILEQMYIDQPKFLDAQMKAAQDQAFLQQSQSFTPPQVANAWADRMGYVEFVKQRGVTEAQARACLSDAKAIDALTKLTQDGTEKHDVTGTPTFILNGAKVDGVTWAQVEAALKNAGA
ncbi:MAG: protein-disulfide isomerase [Sphingomonas taxi]|uniref:Protein-disulfide isomerase n=1 Tax=Sphingomonas taxi TaxID=1549858 RepID=A0A2W5PEB3_9SPHN|nr:MAG: protein-disulfide isomerase [Sphingomonas taxi]